MKFLLKFFFIATIPTFVSCQKQLPKQPNLVATNPSYTEFQVRCITHCVASQRDAIRSPDSVFGVEGDTAFLRRLQQCGYRKSYFSVDEIAEIVLSYKKLFGVTRAFEKAAKLLYFLDDGEDAGFFSDRFPDLAKEYANKPQSWLLE